MTLFDTDVLVWAFRGYAKAESVVSDTQERALSLVSYMELLHGAKNARESAMFRNALSAMDFRFLPITESITAKAVSLMEALSLSNGIGPMDALVFATALDGDHVLCSANYKHYKDVPGLRARRFVP